MLNIDESHKKLDWYAEHYTYNVDYMREMLSVAPEAYETFEAFFPMANFSKNIPVDVLHVAKITSMKNEDCEDCFQLIIDMAIEAGVEKEIVKEVVLNNALGLTPELKDVHDFTLAVVKNRGIEEALYAKMAKNYSREIMTELGLAIASMQVFPTIRRTLNASKSCSLSMLRI